VSSDRSDAGPRDPRLDAIRRAMGRDAPDEVDEELRFHLDGVEEELRATGLSDEEARRVARARFGDVDGIAAALRTLTHQRGRSMTRSEWVRAALRDVQYATRMLRRAPAFSISALLTLALGIGATMAIVTVAYGIWLKPLPYADPERLVTIGDTYRGGSGGTVSAAEIADFRANSALEGVAAYSYAAAITAIDGEPVRVLAYRVTPNLFSVLGVRAALGRTFDPASDASADGPMPVVLSNAFWRARYGSDPNVIGRRLDLFDVAATIVGVMPPEFRFPQSPASDVWIPLDPGSLGAGDRNVRYTQAIARLRPGFTIDEARARMATIASRLAIEHPESNSGWSILLTSFVDETIGEYRAALGLLLGIVGALLLIVCANIASLLLARNTARQRELAVRAALGASRARLAMHVMAESVVLSLVGGALGLGLATLGASALATMLPRGAPRLDDIGTDWPVVLCAVAVSIVTGLLCSVAPSFRASAATSAAALRETGRTTTGRHRLQSTLVVFEVAISLTLLVAAGAILRSFVRLTGRDHGFVANELLTLHVTLPFDRYRDPTVRTQLLDEALSRIRLVPGVRNAGAVTGYPGSGMGFLGGGPVTADPARSQEAVSVSVRAADPAYLETMGTPLVAGRFFSSDDRSASEPVMVVNHTLARRLWPGDNPVGKRLALPASMSDLVTHREFTVIGVAGDMRIGATASPQVFIPWAQVPVFWADIVVRTDGDPTRYAAAVRRTLAALDHDLLTETVSPMTAILADYSALQRSQTVIATALGALATLLSAVGIFGLLLYLVGQRRREIGVRLALGASRSEVFAVGLRRGMQPAVLGIGIGGLAAKGLVAVLSARVFGLSDTGPSIFAAAGGLMLVVAAGAAFIPAWRATRVDPMTTMR
jgi:predicted permease